MVVNHDTFIMISKEEAHLTLRQFKVNNGAMTVSVKAEWPGTGVSANLGAVDKQIKQLYTAYFDDALLKIDMESGSTDISNETCHYSIHDLLLIGGDLHVFAFDIALADTHLLLNDQTGYYQLTEEEMPSIFSVDCFSLNFAVYCEKRNSIIQSGYKTSANSRCRFIPIFGEYSLSSKKWRIWEYPQYDESVHSHTTVVCTSNGRYFITLGGEQCCDSNSKEVVSANSIIVYDLENHTVKPRVSAARCPEKANFHALSMADEQFDELLTFGFVRDEYGKDEMRGIQVLPHYMIQMMGKWVETEWIYLIKRKGTNMWRMRVDQILDTDCSLLK